MVGVGAVAARLEAACRETSETYTWRFEIPCMARFRTERLEAAQACVENVLDALGPAAVDALRARLSASADAWSYYSADPVAREIHYAMAPLVLKHPPQVFGIDNLDAVRNRPFVIVSNHLSYSDANVIQVLLHQP